MNGTPKAVFSRQPVRQLTDHLKFEVVEEERFWSGAVGRILVPRR